LGHKGLKVSVHVEDEVEEKGDEFHAGNYRCPPTILKGGLGGIEASLNHT